MPLRHAVFCCTVATSIEVPTLEKKMVTVTCNTHDKQILALKGKIYTGRKEREALIRAIFAYGKLSGLLKVSHLLNTKEVGYIKKAYGEKIDFYVAMQLLHILPSSKGYVATREWLLTILLKAPMKHLLDDKTELVQYRKKSVWWPSVALKRKKEMTLFFDKVANAGKDLSYALVLQKNYEFMKKLTQEQQTKITLDASIFSRV